MLNYYIYIGIIQVSFFDVSEPQLPIATHQLTILNMINLSNTKPELNSSNNNNHNSINSHNSYGYSSSNTSNTASTNHVDNNTTTNSSRTRGLSLSPVNLFNSNSTTTSTIQKDKYLSIETSINRLVKYNTPYYTTTTFKVKANQKAAKLVIKNGAGLPSTNMNHTNIPPSVYCTVYLIDSNGEKKSLNNENSRTEVIKSFDPIWNKELLLQNEQVILSYYYLISITFLDKLFSYY